MSQLAFLLEREVIIALALAGAMVATLGNVLMLKRTVIDPGTARHIMRAGYGVTWASIGLFIIAGFVGE